MASPLRKTSQFLMPAIKPEAEQDKYDIYPTFNIGSKKIFRGLNTLASKIAIEKTVILDGFSGVSFDLLKRELNSLLKNNFNLEVTWINAENFLKTESEIDKMILPFLGSEDPVFGKRTTCSLSDFFSDEKLIKYRSAHQTSHTIIYGTDAGLIVTEGFLVYIDLPKNELQFRARAGAVANLGSKLAQDPKSMYKRFYFVDWVVLGKYKQSILDRIDILIDEQRGDDITWISGDDFQKNLHDLSQNPIRVRPWFEPGVWGGSWIIDHISGINYDVPNYAWSFELITPENGLILESSGLMLEFSFDFLMFREAEKVLGDCYGRFGTEFPLRFDFLDTFNGGNLSIQCHPQPGYMKENFGENFTQEETYYILDTKDNADVYLGFQENIDKSEFKTALEESFLQNKPVKIDKFVQRHTSHKHDLFLIPYGTIHGSGKNNLVLEISTTPYIFTFKMYDWLRPDLDGKPRPLNIERGFRNLFFDRQGISVAKELISSPVLIEKGENWKLFHLPTHKTHLYGLLRYHFVRSIDVKTRNKLHVLSLVEGKSILIEIPGKMKRKFSFAETFIIPASVEDYRVNNLSGEPVILIVAFIK
jgi:mannose-6-phosphate isomerase class I